MDAILNQLDSIPSFPECEKSTLIQNAVRVVTEQVPFAVRIFLKSVLTITSYLDAVGEYSASVRIARLVLMDVEGAVANRSLATIYKTVMDFTFDLLRGEELDKFERFYNTLLQKYHEKCDVLLAGVHSCSFLFLKNHKNYEYTLYDVAECFKAWKLWPEEIHVRLQIIKEVQGKNLSIAIDKLACAYYNAGSVLCVNFHERALTLSERDLPERVTIVKDHLATSHKKFGDSQKATVIFKEVMACWRESDDVFILYRRGRSVYRHGALGQATKILLKALHVCNTEGYRGTPVEGKILYYLAKCSVRAGHNDVALQLAESARDNQYKRHPESYGAYMKSVNLIGKLKEKN